jgi:hypothetical protein
VGSNVGLVRFFLTVFRPLTATGRSLALPSVIGTFPPFAKVGSNDSYWQERTIRGSPDRSRETTRVGPIPERQVLEEQLSGHPFKKIANLVGFHFDRPAGILGAMPPKVL